MLTNVCLFLPGRSVLAIVTISGPGSEIGGYIDWDRVPRQKKW